MSFRNLLLNMVKWKSKETEMEAMTEPWKQHQEHLLLGADWNHASEKPPFYQHYTEECNVTWESSQILHTHNAPNF